jgi:hypothetical protein
VLVTATPNSSLKSPLQLTRIARPRLHLIRFHGVLERNSTLLAQVARQASQVKVETAHAAGSEAHLAQAYPGWNICAQGRWCDAEVSR